MDRQYVELFKQLIRLKTTHDPENMSEHDRCRDLLKAEAEKRGSKLTPLPFIVKAVAAALVAEPSFNVSVHQDGESIVHKKFVHIGIAVDTPNGLLVPVVRNVDKKGLFELADEINANLCGPFSVVDIFG